MTPGVFISISPQARKAVQVKVAVTVEGFQHPVTFEKEADVEIIGHAYAAMHLDGLGRCKLRCFTQLGLGETREFRYVISVLIQRLQCFEYQ